MRGQEAPPNESEYGFSLPHLLGLGGLVAGIGFCLLLPAPQPTKSAGPTPAQAKFLAEVTPKPANISDATVPRVKPAVAERSAVETIDIRPAIAERPVVPEKVPVVVAAVAEKPSADLWNSELPAQVTEIDLESYLSNSVPTVGLDIKQAEKAANYLREERRALRPGSRATHSNDLRMRIATTSSEMSAGKSETSDEKVDKLAELIEAGDIKGLPMGGAHDCELEQSKARSLEKYSRMLHAQITEIDRSVRLSGSDAASFSSDHHIAHRDSALAHAIGNTSELATADAIPALVQILEVEPEVVRQQLVDRLQETQTPEATRALVGRAVFDLSPAVRVYARQALKDRSAKEVRPELLKALRYPWSPVAWNAAEALVAVNDKDAVPSLVELLDDPDPSKPFVDESGKMVVRELVRVNHFQNCLLCHAPSRSSGDLVQASVPVPGEPIRPVYYGSRGRFGSALVRADITYLRQDFSVMHTVEDVKFWPERQRFDYLVRTREATDEEISAGLSGSRFDYPQRDAVLYALQKLTGRNEGKTAEAWRRIAAVP